MKTPTSNQEQNFTDSFDADKNNKKKTPAEEVKENPIPMQSETVNEHGKVGQETSQQNPDNSPSAKPQTNVEKSTDEKVKEKPDDKELRIVEEKGMVGQPLGNRIQNTNFKNQTPAEKDRERKLTEDDINPSKEERKTTEPDNKVGQPIGSKIPNKDSSAKPQSN